MTHWTTQEDALVLLQVSNGTFKHSGLTPAQAESKLKKLINNSSPEQLTKLATDIILSIELASLRGDFPQDYAKHEWFLVKIAETLQSKQAHAA